MGEKKRTGKKGFTVKKLVWRLLKAFIKTVIIYFIFEIITGFMGSFESFQDYQMVSNAFMVLYVFFIFATELARGTIFQHVFAVANSMMFILYFANILNTSAFSFAVEQIQLMIDLRFFLGIFVVGSILGLAKNMLGFILWMHEREELWLAYQIKSL
jgi:hypothetical protein